MKLNTSFLKRCIALAVALVLLVSSSNLGSVLRAFAVEDESVTITDGQLVAKSYELTAAEKALLSSGLLQGATHTYKVPTSDTLVEIKLDEKLIIAADYEEWKPVAARIIVNNATEETVEFVDGKANFAYAGDAFTVEVDYELNYVVDKEAQYNMLHAAAWIKAAMKAMAEVKDLEESLEIVESATDVLDQVVQYGIAEKPEEFEIAVRTLKNQMARWGKLPLRVFNENYNDSVKYAVEKANEYKVTVNETYNALYAIQNDGILTNSILNTVLDSGMQMQLSIFLGILNDLVADLKTISEADWTLTGKDVVRSGLEDGGYALLNVYIGNIEQSTDVPMEKIQETLNAAKTTIRKNQSQVSVNVKVELSVVKDNEIVSGGVYADVVGVRENAAKADVLAAIEEKGIIAAAKAKFGAAFVEGCFDEAATALPDVLTKDVDYTVSYTPKNYQVSYSYGVAEQRPYGYVVTLPIHEQAATLAYDYVVNGESFMQGESVTVTGETVITRTEGPAYLTTTLFEAIAQSYGNEVAMKIVQSGALKGNSGAIYYRTPVFNEDLKLYEGELSAPIYTTANGNVWKPYSYTFKDQVLFFAGQDKVTFTDNQSRVRYALQLNADPAQVASILAMLGDVKAEYDAQKTAMDDLLGFKDDLAELKRMTLNILKTIIDTVKDTDPFSPKPAENERIAAHLKTQLDGIINACMPEKASNLFVYDIVVAYEVEGMSYYWQNSEEIITRVAELSKYVGEMLKEYDALVKLLKNPDVLDLNPNLATYGEKLNVLGERMVTISEQLVPANAGINLNDVKALRNLSAALSEKLELAPVGDGKVYILSDEKLVKDSSARNAYAEIIIDGVVYTVYTEATVTYGEKLTQEMVDDLKAKIEKLINEKLGTKINYYTRTDDINAKLVAGVVLEEDLKITVTCDAKNYTVKIEDEADQQININDLVIDLPRYPSVGETIDLVYFYYIDGAEETAAVYTFNAEQLDRLFKNGVLEIKREARNQKQIALNSFLKNMKDAGFYMEGNKMVAEIELSASVIEALAAGLMEGDYNYIGMNGEPFMYSTADGFEISLQTVLNAILNDPTFSNKTIIDLGKNNGGKVLVTNLQLGLDENTLFENALAFELRLKSVPEQMVTVANALNALKNNFSFKANNGKLDVDLTLPEKVYEIYLTALLVAGEVDTNDINAIDNEIAFRFLSDYVDFILGNEKITATTFQNTLDMLDKIAFDKIPNKDLTAYAKYLEAIRDVYKNVDIVTSPDAPVNVTVSATGNALNKVLGKLPVEIPSLFLGLVKELKVANADKVVLTATADLELTNTVKDFEAVIIDVDAAIEGGKELVGAYKNGALKSEAVDLLKGKGLANAADYTSNLANRLTTVTGPAAIYLLSDVEGDLVINTTTVLDLNGFTVKGDIIVNGKLLIVDSTIDTDDCGWVEGEISGNAFIVAGNYKTNVSKFLMDGYKQVGTSVQNAMYTFEVVGDSITLVLNSDFMDECDGWLPSIRALAADIAVDLALNFYIPASLTNVYGIGDNFNDILGLLNRHDVGEIADLALSLIDVEGISDVANAIIADMMKFGAIADAIDNETAMGGYTLTTMPWAVEFMHVYEEGVSDYLTIGIVAKDEAVKSTTVNIKLVGDNIKRVVALLRELDRIVVDEETFVNIDVKQPVRDGKFVNIAGSAEAQLSVDLTVDKEYQTVLAVIFAYGTPAKANALISALGDENALNAAFNDMTVREIIKSLGAMSRNVSFAQMAAAVGADITAEAAELESLYHFVACAAGKALAKLESMNINGLVDRAENAADKAVDKFESYDDKELPTRFGDVAEKILDKLDLTTLKPIFDKAGNVIDRVIAKVDLDSKLGALDQGDGSYVLQYAYSRAGDVEARGYGVNYNVENISGLIKVKVFDRVDCLWGDANHDGEVNAKDASFVLQYSAGVIDADQYFCTLRTDVNDDGEINAKDASLILQHTAGNISKFPVEG